MKKYSILYPLILILFTVLLDISAICQSDFKTYENDPLNLKEAVMENGMKVYLVENHDKPEISGAIVVNVGSKNDPADNTGMAHYLEHMLFKGTKDLGTIDYEKEKVHLDKIVSLYDELGKETDEEKRKVIQGKINDESNLAAKYALPNEFDRIISEMGGTRLNAFTSADMTVYLNTFPPNQIEKWLDVYIHRFKDPVFRLFQSELETVYEEKNRAMNEPLNFLIEHFMAQVFKGHPYGDQTTLGKTEHLKNPSLSTMYNYFYKYYVPNNMALVLVGDFKSEEILPLIKAKVNELPFKELKKQDQFSIEPIKGKQVTTIKSSPIKMTMFGFRVDDSDGISPAQYDVMRTLLSNDAQTGLVDQLSTNGEVLGTFIMDMPFNDFKTLAIINIPKLVGQSFEEAEALLFSRLDSLKKGKFEESSLKAIKQELMKNRSLRLESNQEIAMELYTHFVSGKGWDMITNYEADLEKVTKEDIVKLANSFFGDDYIAIYSKMGSTPSEKMVKPERDPIIVKNKQKSKYYLSFLDIKEAFLEPSYVNFEKDIDRVTLENGAILNKNENPVNNIFQLEYRWGIGNYDNNLLIHLTEYLNSVGSTEKEFEAFKKELQMLNSSCYFSSDDRYFYLFVDGEDRNLEPTVKLLAELINSPATDETKLKEIVESATSEIKFEKSSPGSIANAVREYALYGENSRTLRKINIKALKAITTQDYLSLFEEVKKYPLEISYSGNSSELEKALNEVFKSRSSLTQKNGYINRKEVENSENIIYFVNQKKSTQANIHFNFPLGKIPVNEFYKMNAFNEYFGGGMSSLVFQEIREFRSLAYSSAGICVPGKTPKNNAMFYGFVGCQNDKTIEAMEIMMGLIKDMPEKVERIDYIRGATVRSSLTSVPGFRDLIEQVNKWKELGYDKDPSEKFKSDYENLKFEDISDFYKSYVKGKPVVISIVGDKKQIDFKALSKYGKIVELKMKEVYAN